MRTGVGLQWLVAGATLAAMGCDGGGDVIDAQTDGAIDAPIVDAMAGDAIAGDAPTTDAPAPDATAPDAAATDAPTTDATVTDAAAIDAVAVDAVPIPIDAVAIPIDALPSDGCAAPPVGNWTGTASMRYEGAGAFEEASANVNWTRVATTACVDRYQPSGTASFDFDGQGCDNGEWVMEPASAPIAPTDGELVVDRTTNPPTYTMNGETRWQAAVHCSDEPAGPLQTVGRDWADHTGSFDGDVLAGGFLDNVLYFQFRWRFVRDGAVFTPPVTGCSEPAAEHWTTVTKFQHTVATATWTRSGTSGCVDTFSPQGTVNIPVTTSSACPMGRVYVPDSAPIEAGDGVLTIDRSTDPATFAIHGSTWWSADRECHRADGSVVVDQIPGGGAWARFSAELDGDRFGAEFMRNVDPYAWRFTRM